MFLCTIVSPYFIVESLQLRGRRQIAKPCKYCFVRVIVFFGVCFLYLFCFSQVGILVKIPYNSPLDANGYRLPQYLYANEFVSELDLSFCKIKPIGLLHWTSLKRLCIRKSAVCEDVIRKVLMGSPRLEYLELNDCYEFNRLDIVSESLRKLVIDSCLVGMLESEEHKLELEIVAPKI